MKKGQLSMETIIIVILALLVLVILALAFSGEMKKLWDRITGIESTIPQTEVEQARATCKSLCDSKFQAWCTQTFAGDLGAKYPNGCREIMLMPLGCSGVTCPLS